MMPWFSRAPYLLWSDGRIPAAAGSNRHMSLSQKKTDSMENRVNLLANAVPGNDDENLRDPFQAHQ